MAAQENFMLKENWHEMKPGTSQNLDNLSINSGILSATGGTLVKQEQLTGRVGKQTWTCNICKKELSSKRSYTEHLNIHNKIRPFRCEHCSYAAASNMTLHRHRLRNHTPKCEWGYRCPYCDEAYMEPAGYQQHVQIRHPGKSATYGCPFRLCSLKSKSQRHFREHLAKHDRNDKIEGGLDPNILTSQELVRFVIKDEIGSGFARPGIGTPLQKVVIRARPLVGIAPKIVKSQHNPPQNPPCDPSTSSSSPSSTSSVQMTSRVVHVQPRGVPVPYTCRPKTFTSSGVGNPFHFPPQQHQNYVKEPRMVWREPKVTIRGVPVAQPVAPQPPTRYYVPSSTSCTYRNPIVRPSTRNPPNPLHSYFYEPAHPLPRSYEEIPDEFEVDTDLRVEEDYGSHVQYSEMEEYEEEILEDEEEEDEDDEEDEGPPVLDRQEQNEKEEDYCRQMEDHEEWMEDDPQHEINSEENVGEVFPNGFIEDELD